MRHLCHAHECKMQVPPAMFMCRVHWFSLPKAIRDAVWRAYRPGQEEDKRVTYRYMAIQRLAVGHVAFKPDDEAAAAVAARYLLEAAKYRQMAIDAGQGDPLEGLVPT